MQTPKKLQNANSKKITKCKLQKNYKMQTPKKIQKKKIKKVLKPKDFFNFFPLGNGTFIFFPWIMGKFSQKNIRKKLKKFFRGKIGKTEPQV